MRVWLSPVSIRCGLAALPRLTSNAQLCMQLLKFGIQEYIKILESSQKKLAEKTLGKDGLDFVKLPSDWLVIAQFGLLLDFTGYITVLQAVPYPVSMIGRYGWVTRVLACAGRPRQSKDVLESGIPGTEQVAGPRRVVQRKFAPIAPDFNRWAQSGYKEPNETAIKVLPGKTFLTLCYISV